MSYGTLALLLCTLLINCILSSILTLVLIGQKVLDPRNQKDIFKPILPDLGHIRPPKTHISLIDGRGNVQDFVLHNDFELVSNQNESLKIPGSQYGFVSFENHRTNYLLYGDFKLGMCTDFVTNQGKLLPDSQPPLRFLYSSRKLRVGEHFWILDTLSQPGH